MPVPVLRKDFERAVDHFILLGFFQIPELVIQCYFLPCTGTASNAFMIPSLGNADKKRDEFIRRRLKIYL
jgi:hypothetical protein